MEEIAVPVRGYEHAQLEQMLDTCGSRADGQFGDDIRRIYNEDVHQSYNGEFLHMDEKDWWKALGAVSRVGDEHGVHKTWWLGKKLQRRLEAAQ